MGETPFAAASLRSRSTERSNRMPPKSFGCSVFTRPPKTSGKPVTSATLVTGRPAAARCAAVPPVERRPKPSPVRARAKSTRPVRSDTERSARRVLLTDGVRSFRSGVLRDGRDVASGSLPDPGEEAGREGDGRVVALARGGRGKRRRGQYFGRREGLRRIAEKAGGLRDVRGRAARAGFGGHRVAHALHEPATVSRELTLEVRRRPGGRLGRHPSLVGDAPAHWPRSPCGRRDESKREDGGEASHGGRIVRAAGAAGGSEDLQDVQAQNEALHPAI